jgi:2-polyprenyl-6-methoxyphenol hydroxylase-like FAD-dependent oxidoreductase
LAAAIALRALGFRVTVADPAQPPIDKPCAEGLMPGAVAALHRLGVTLPPQHSFEFSGIRFLGDGVTSDASFPNAAGVGIRRTHLQQALVDRARQCGVTMLWGTLVKGLTPVGVLLESGEVRCRWVVGADGEHSRVRRWARLESVRRESSRWAFRRHYQISPWSDRVEIHWRDDCQIYVTPIGPNEVCVASTSRDQHLRLEQALARCPELAARLHKAPTLTRERGAVTSTRLLKRVNKTRVFLVGDSSGSVDSICGEGLRLGFEQGLALADALSSNDSGAYAAAHRRLMRRPAFMASLMLSLDRSSWLRRRVLRAFSKRPDLFATHLAMHAGESTPVDFLRGSLLPLTLRILEL